MADNCTYYGVPYVFLADNVTTADNTDPYAWTFSMALCIFAAIVFSWMHLTESVFALFKDFSAKTENKVDTKTARAIHDWYGVKIFDEFLTIGFVFTMFGFTMFNMNAKFDSETATARAPLDNFAYVAIWIGFTYFFLHKIFNLYSVVKRYMYVNQARKKDEKLESIVACFHQVGSDTYTMGGIARVHYWVRVAIIIVDMLTWGIVPTVMAWYAFGERKDVAEPGQLWVVPFTATIYTSYLFVHMVVARGNWLANVRSNTSTRNDAANYAITFDATMPYVDLNKLRIGHAADIIGDGTCLRGEIPVDYISSAHLVVRIFIMASCAALFYQDTVQTVAFVVCVELVPLFMTALAQNNQFFVAYEMSAFFWYFVLSYFWAMNIYPCEVNQQLSVLNGMDYGVGETQADYDFVAVRLSYILPACVFVYAFLFLGEESLAWELGRTAIVHHGTGKGDKKSTVHSSSAGNTDMPFAKMETEADEQDRDKYEDNPLLTDKVSQTRRRVPPNAPPYTLPYGHHTTYS